MKKFIKSRNGTIVASVLTVIGGLIGFSTFVIFPINRQIDNVSAETKQNSKDIKDVQYQLGNINGKLDILLSRDGVSEKDIKNYLISQSVGLASTTETNGRY